MKICTPQFLRSLITNLNSKFKMADRNCKFYVQTHNQCPSQPTSTEFYLNQSVLFVFSFAIFVCHFEFLNFEFRFVISSVKITHEYQDLFKWSRFLHFCPPYWIRHFEFLNFKFRFVISTLKNPRVQVFGIKNVPAILSTFCRVLSANEGVNVNPCCTEHLCFNLSRGFRVSF